MTAWIITEDKITDKDAPEGTNLNAKGLVGPSCITEADEARLRAGEGKRFRMKDDDGEIYYYGRWLETDECTEQYEGGVGEAWQDGECAPLDNFGRPNAGCTQLEYAEGHDDKGNVIWEGLF